MKSFLYISHPFQKDYSFYLENLKEGDYNFKFSPFDGSEKEINVKMSRRDELDSIQLPCKQRAVKSYSKKEYVGLIQKTIIALKEKDFGKAVISRPKEIPSPNIEAVKAFKSLVKAYPNACVYLFGNNDAGLWMGASPETLVEGKMNEIWTISLAGTRKKDGDLDFGNKEYKEQELVTEYIKHVFENTQGLEDIEIGEREISEAANLLHLSTKIRAKKNADFGLDLFLKEYHPTPAVGGNPKQETLKLISDLEMHSRSYYTGYFGLEHKNSFHYFVNLRCMQLLENSVVLYAGGGITAESDALDEWNETESKMKTLLNVLQDQL